MDLFTPDLKNKLWVYETWSGTILNSREKLVLEAVVRNYILTSNPVASTYIAKTEQLSFSPATIRNIMAALEEKGYIYQPHTSAGRIPTNRGYRLYVDEMMGQMRLPVHEKSQIQDLVQHNPGDFEKLLNEASRILSILSSQLSIIISPPLEEGTFHRMELTPINQDKILIIISIKSGLVKTIVIEVDSELEQTQLSALKDILNERLTGLKLKEIRSHFREIISDIDKEEFGLLRLFIDAAPKIFNFDEDKAIYRTGTHNILRQPDFFSKEELSGVVEVLENQKIIVHLLDKYSHDSNMNITIGNEIDEEIMAHCSIISTRYKFGQVSGSIGIVGPTRMNYTHIVPLVQFTANTLTSISE